ncbi:RmlC-like jelly roll fold [Sesbania bispinosa]|nr:RmlC-like jelly roll fold [Sesbania bispinosa]
MCLFVDGWFAVTVTVLRCMTDALHLWNILLRFKMAKRSFGFGGDTGAAADAGSSVALRYLKSRRGFFFDFFVILPIPQIVLWVAIPSLLEKGSRGMLVLVGDPKGREVSERGCAKTSGCGIKMLSCHKPMYYGSSSLMDRERGRLAWAENREARSTCLNGPDSYNYGAYKWTVQLVTNDNRLEKILFPIFWGLMTLSTFGNLESTTEWLEVVFNIIVLTSGLLLVTMLIGNIKEVATGFRQRVRNYERQRWAAMRGVDECEMTRNLPEGLRRDIKYHLCLDLVRQVPLFQHMDDLVLENICDRVKS